MKLEELIRRRLTCSMELTELLTEYAGAPAIFFGDAPDDNQKGWKNGGTTPRISFTYDTLADRERKSAGSLYVNIYCQNSNGGGNAYPEDIVPVVKKLLKDVIFSPDDFGIFYCSWKSTDSFSLNETDSNVAYKNNLVIGCDMVFDILEYPDQKSTDPDPVMALNQYIADNLKEAFVLHYHHIQDCIETSDDMPVVVYVRNAGYSLARQTNTVCWMKGLLYVHLLCPDSSVRMKVITALANRIALSGEVIMLDGSPMFISAIEVNNSADYMVSGQMKLETAYGVLRTKPLDIAIKGLVIRKGGEDDG